MAHLQAAICLTADWWNRIEAPLIVYLEALCVGDRYHMQSDQTGARILMFLI